jgi:tetratricopeptide (TPR) repeat protein
MFKFILIHNNSVNYLFMKKLLCIISFVLMLNSVHAQSASAEAKAAYLLAEEEFSGGKYADAIAYLDEATAKLGNANAKILYLKIMALRELAQQDEEKLEPLKKAITAFEKAPDFSSFNEEKQLEVMKLKLKLSKDGTLGKSVSALEASVYSRLGISGWQVGVKLEDMKTAHPDYFSRATRTPMGDTMEVYMIISEQNFGVVVKKGMVFAISKALNANEADDASFSKGYALFNELKNYLGGSPEEKVTNNSYTSTPAKYGGFKWVTKALTWKYKNTQAYVSFMTNETTTYKQPVSYTSNIIMGVGYLEKQ